MRLCLVVSALRRCSIPWLCGLSISAGCDDAETASNTSWSDAAALGAPDASSGAQGGNGASSADAAWAPPTDASSPDATWLPPDTARPDAANVPPIGRPGGDAARPAGGCGANDLLPLPADPKQRGPWDVGVRTVKVDRLTIELVYPAKPGSTAGVPEATYDIRKWLPAPEQNKVPADHSPAVGPIGGRFFRGVPIDDQHGPYPVVIFIHGTASFRIASGSTAAHWASRGFVVLSADYPGLGLADQLSDTFECAYPLSGEQDLPSDVTKQLEALGNPSGDLAFLANRIDMTRIGISGHSQGGCVSATLSTLPNVRIVMPFSGSTAVDESPSLESVLFVSGIDDAVIGYDIPWIGNVVCPLGSTTTELAYEFSPGPPEVKRRLVGITGGGHLVVTDLCQKNAQGNNAIDEANANQVCGIESAVIIGLPALFDCGTIDWKVGLEAVNYATTAALEETLHCLDRSQQFAMLRSALPQVGDFREQR